jgi:hypothetical protein
MLPYPTQVSHHGQVQSACKRVAAGLFKASSESCVPRAAALYFIFWMDTSVLGLTCERMMRTNCSLLQPV